MLMIFGVFFLTLDDEGSVRARLPIRLIAKRTDSETVTDIIR